MRDTYFLGSKNRNTPVTVGGLVLASSFALLPSLSHANTTHIDLLTSPDPATALQLEVVQAPLAQILDKLKQTTHIPIHYSVLPEGQVTATCVGASVKQILECLLNHKADLIFRYHHKSESHSTQEPIEEAWVLGAKFDAIAPSVNSAECAATVLKQQAQLQALRHQEHTDTSEAEQTDAMIKLAQSKDPAERAQGIGGLLAAGRPGDPAIRAALQTALSDSNPDVRAQAISSFAHRQEEGTDAALQNALQDESVDVRVMAVDSAGNNRDFLQQALHDKDESVRSLAALKLESMNTHE